jgi:O-antigen ligase
VALAEPTLLDVLGIQEAVVKAAIIALAALAVLRRGVGRIRWPIVLFLLAWIVALAWSLRSTDPMGLGWQGMVVAWLGYLSGWTFLLPGPDPAWRRTVVRGLVAAPGVIVLLGFLTWPLTDRAPFDQDVSGLFRLQGLSIPPHLAMASFVAIAAGIFGARRRLLSRGHAWTVVNAAIAAATLSRGAVAAIAVLLLFGVVLSPGDRRRTAPKLLSVAALSVIGVLAGIGSLARDQGNAYEGSFNTSGRLQAWQFFLNVAERHPWSGNGLGASSVAVATEAPAGVQTAFIAPHNEFIHLYVDTGLALAIALLASLAVMMWTIARASAGALLAVAVMGGMAVLATVDNPLSTPGITLMVALFLRVLLPSIDGNSDRDTRPSSLSVEHPAGDHGPAPGPERMALSQGSGQQLPR